MTKKQVQKQGYQIEAPPQLLNNNLSTHRLGLELTRSTINISDPNKKN